MKYATRLNSFFKNKTTTVDVLDIIGGIEGIEYVDLNYPEHFEKNSIEDIKEALTRNNLLVNGLALRFREEFINGELGNIDEDLSQKALELCKEAVEMCKVLDGEVITIWLGYDGFDYSFQLDYMKAWKKIVSALQEVADVNENIKISFEYKPFEPRAYTLVADAGTTLLLVNDVNRKNMGVTVDFCHMMMKDENPAYGMAQIADRGKLFGVHMNDGYGMQDDGFMIGSVNFMKTLEFVYYLKKYNYTGIIYFDTFPIRENAVEECKMNIKTMDKFNEIVNRIGLEDLDKVIQSNNGVEVQELLLSCVK